MPRGIEVVGVVQNEQEINGFCVVAVDTGSPILKATVCWQVPIVAFIGFWEMYAA
jgi:hypothetical protein